MNTKGVSALIKLGIDAELLSATIWPFFFFFFHSLKMNATLPRLCQVLSNRPHTPGNDARIDISHLPNNLYFSLSSRVNYFVD